MPNIKKQQYYRINREKRLAYQHKWYAQNKSWRLRQIELERELEPESWTLKRDRVSRYNKSYYERNRERIREQRKRVRLRAKMEAAETQNRVRQNVLSSEI